LTVLVTCNASGTDKHKLLVIGNAAQPRCFRKLRMSTLPVHWRANKTAWMNTGVFTWWLTKCFVPAVKAFKRTAGKDATATVRATT
jgi:hypothetical protein